MDFTALQMAGEGAGWGTLGLTTQIALLLALGGPGRAAEALARRQLRRCLAVKRRHARCHGESSRSS